MISKGRSSLEMIQYNNNRGGVGTIRGCLEKLKKVVFLVKHVSFRINFLRRHAFIQKLCLLSFHFSKN